MVDSTKHSLVDNRLQTIDKRESSFLKESRKRLLSIDPKICYILKEYS